MTDRNKPQDGGQKPSERIYEIIAAGTVPSRADAIIRYLDEQHATVRSPPSCRHGLLRCETCTFGPCCRKHDGVNKCQLAMEDCRFDDEQHAAGSGEHVCTDRCAHELEERVNELEGELGESRTQTRQKQALLDSALELLRIAAKLDAAEAPSPEPAPGSREGATNVVGQPLAPLDWTSNGEAGDGQHVCRYCDESTDEPHELTMCIASLRSEREALHGEVGRLQFPDEPIEDPAVVGYPRASDAEATPIAEPPSKNCNGKLTNASGSYGCWLREGHGGKCKFHTDQGDVTAPEHPADVAEPPSPIAHPFGGLCTCWSAGNHALPHQPGCVAFRPSTAANNPISLGNVWVGETKPPSPVAGHGPGSRWSDEELAPPPNGAPRQADSEKAIQIELAASMRDMGADIERLERERDEAIAQVEALKSVNASADARVAELQSYSHALALSLDEVNNKKRLLDQREASLLDDISELREALASANGRAEASLGRSMGEADRQWLQHMLCPSGCRVVVTISGSGRDEGKAHCRICQRCVSIESLAWSAYQLGRASTASVTEDPSAVPNDRDDGRTSIGAVDSGPGLGSVREIAAPPMFAIGSPAWPGLSKLVEEAGETLQVIGKLMGTGGEAAHWDGSDLRMRLIEEGADLLAACDFVVKANALGEAVVEERRAIKLARFFEWHRGPVGAPAVTEPPASPSELPPVADHLYPNGPVTALQNPPGYICWCCGARPKPQLPPINPELIGRSVERPIVVGSTWRDNRDGALLVVLENTAYFINEPNMKIVGKDQHGFLSHWSDAMLRAGCAWVSDPPLALTRETKGET